MRHIKLKSSLPGNRLPQPMPSKFQRSWQGVYSELPSVELRRALYHLNEFPRDIMLSSCFLLMYFALPSWRVTLWDLLKFRYCSICFSITSLKMFKDLKGSFRRQDAAYGRMVGNAAHFFLCLAYVGASFLRFFRCLGKRHPKTPANASRFEQGISWYTQKKHAFIIFHQYLPVFAFVIFCNHPAH